MRGFSTVATALSLSFVPAHSLVFPAAIPDTALKGLPEEAPKDAAAPIFNEHSNLGDYLDASPADENNVVDDVIRDPVDDWLDSIVMSDATDGSILTSSLFETFSSLTTGVSSATSFPEVTPSAFPSVLTSASQDVDAPQPTPASYKPRVWSTDGSQKPLQGWRKAWTSTKMKLKAATEQLCPLHSEKQQPVGDQLVIDLEHDKDAQADDSSSIVVDDTSTPTPSRARLGHFFKPTVAAVPTATAAFSSVISSSTVAAPTSVAARPADDSVPATFLQMNNKHTFAIIISVSVTLLLACIIFKIMVRRNPRRRAERLAEWEECRNRRIYATAAMKHRMWAWNHAQLNKIWLLGVWVVGRWPKSQNSEEDSLEKGAIEIVPPADAGANIDPLLSEVHSFQLATARIQALVSVEENAVTRALGKRHLGHNDHRTYRWLFGGGRTRRQRPRAHSGSESDCSDGHSTSEKSSITAPPPYAEREKYVKIPDFVAAKMIATADARDVSDKSSVSSLVPTSPKEGSMTLGSNDSDSEKEI